MSENKTKEKTTSNAVKAAVVILGFLLFFGIVFAVVWWMQTENQKMLDNGCTGSGSSDQYGNPTYWTCPIK